VLARSGCWGVFDKFDLDERVHVDEKVLSWLVKAREYCGWEIEKRSTN
jgi:hypothetical protein